MGLPPLRTSNVSTFVDSDRKYQKSAVTGVGALDSAYQAAGGEAIICDSTSVALIDEIVLGVRTNDASSNFTITLRVNGLDLPFHFPGLLNQVRHDRIVLRPNGNMVIHPGQTFTAKASTAGQSHCYVKYRHKRVSQALADGDLRGGGTLPQVASTNSVAGAGTVAATSKQIIAPVAGMSVEILGAYLTGHSYNAAADNIRLGFWDGVSGTFLDSGATILRGWAMGASHIFAPRILIDDTRGCIQGNNASGGDGVYIQASANLAGNPAPADWVVMYRRVPTLEAAPFGTIGLTPTQRKKWWCNTELAGGAAIDDFFAAPDTVTGNQMVKVHGHAWSCTHTDAALSVIGLSSGDGLTQGLSDMAHVGGDGAAAAVSSSAARTNMNAIIRLGDGPGFLAFDLVAAMTNRSQLAWGTFGSSGEGERRSTIID